ncbi:MAG: UDP-N-acetylmuramate dehydrogenase [Pseudohongiella sp.]|nr:UDP-N-acetylmuramate dehydrogenase [Pseudohongiella sp.]
MEIQQDIDLAPYNSFGISQQAAYFADVRQVADLQQALAFAQQQQLPMQVLGAGSNTLFTRDFPGLIVQMNCKGIERLPGTDSVKAACGENWHDLVKYCLNNNLYGIENLALIPGTVGAAPIQNIGAYGVELAQLFLQLEAWDSRSGELHCMTKSACQFGYRDSLFKQAAGQHLIVLSLTLQLSQEYVPRIDYHGLKQAFGGAEPGPRQVFDKVCEIRRGKLPDPGILGNAGSFFKNPVIAVSQYQALQQQYPDLPAYDTEEAASVKLPAAWLLEQIGAKGRRRGGAAVHAEHALVLVNTGSASGEDILLLAQELSDAVLQTFGISLQTEVRIV